MFLRKIICRWKVWFYYTEAVEYWKKLSFDQRLYLLIYFIYVTQGCTV